MTDQPRFYQAVYTAVLDAMREHQTAEQDLAEALEAMLDCYGGVYDMAVPTKHQSDEAKRAEALARAALARARGEGRAR